MVPRDAYVTVAVKVLAAPVLSTSSSSYPVSVSETVSTESVPARCGYSSHCSNRWTLILLFPFKEKAGASAQACAQGSGSGSGSEAEA